MSFSGADSPTHIWVSGPTWHSSKDYERLQHMVRKEEAGAIRELRSLWRAAQREDARKIAEQLREYASANTGLLKGMRVVQDGSTVYVQG